MGRRRRYTDPDALFEAFSMGEIDEDDYAEQLSEIQWRGLEDDDDLVDDESPPAEAEGLNAESLPCSGGRSLPDAEP